MAEKIMLIDGNSILNRAFYGIPLLTDSKGRYTNAVYGFLNILFKLIDEEKPEYIAIAYDLKTPTFRHKKFEGYKAGRKSMPPELYEQMPRLKLVLSAMNIRQYEIEGFEADDILGTLAKKAKDSNLIPVVVSGDKDLLQLADSVTKVRIPKTKGGKTETEDYFESDVIKKYGVTPLQFIDVKALMGDPSDNIPGVSGIGEKTALKIISEFKTLDNAIENADKITPKRMGEKLIEHKEIAILSRFLATIDLNTPIKLNLEEMEEFDIYSPAAYELFKDFEFKSLILRLDMSKPKEEKKTNYLRLATKTEALGKLDEITKLSETAYVILKEDEKLSGIAFFSEKTGGFWLEAGNELSPEDIILLTKEFFENAEYKKIAHDAKDDIRFMRNYGVAINGIIFDTALAGYILNPTRDTYEFDDISAEFLNKSLPSEAEVLGKGKSKKSLFSLLPDERTDFAVCRAETAYKAKDVMSKDLAKNNQETLYYDIELPLLYVLSDMEKYGIKINEEALKAYGVELGKKIDILTDEIYNMAGESFNINSPKQMGKVLFEKMGLSGGKKTKTGYSTAAGVLEKLKNDNPIIEKILEYRQLTKLKSTYADGLLAVMDRQTGKIYSTFNQTITATGRISSTEPNLQNIPIRLELGRKLRKVFIPTNKDFVFLDADYSQIELRILAHMSGDETLINAFKNNQDIHRLTASQVLGIPFEEVTPTQRTSAKAVNFGIIYGIGAFSLSQDIGVSVKEAENYIAGYFAKYPNIRLYMDKTIEGAEKDGYVSTIFNRRRALPEIKSSDHNVRAFGRRVAMNMPIQGTAADIIKIAMIKVYKALKDEGLKSRIILQVHDELLIECEKTEMPVVYNILKDNMENAVKLKVPLDIDIHEGNTWYDTK